MVLGESVFGLSGAPPMDFAPGRMLNGLNDQRWQDIRVANRRITVGISRVGTFASQIKMPPTPQRVFPLSLEIQDHAITRNALLDIPFEVTQDQKGVVTLSSEQQQTSCRFRIRIGAESKEMSLSFTLNYSGLNVEEARRGVAFYKALVNGGELRIHGRHPVTGGDLHIARGAIPAGTYQAPDSRFAEILERLALIESKTGASFIEPEHDISFDDANTIASTARILETGHGKFTANPWISVSSTEQARTALETYASGKPTAMAIHFEGQVVVIFGTHIILGPVTFFCDRTYIRDEDLVDLRNQLNEAVPESRIRIRFSPFEDSLIEGRYVNWLPAEEAVAIKALPIYESREPMINEDKWSLPPMDVDVAVALLTSWYDEDTEEQRKMWESIKVALDQDRLSNRKLFP